ncbi:MAG: ABC transporter ATP-binding protein, partial [bacterium]|nr:ABC transporter ATP-binding protein [bacterium]
FVSQNTNTVMGNLVTTVAWGIPNAQIDRDKIDDALKEAKLYDQIMESPNGLNTVINRDGTGLSQGQKQRIGIARAFYRKPELLIFDEATSSLDLKTESEIMNILEDKKGKLTMIVVSHRMSTLKLCDKIIYMSEGKVVDIDTFANLTHKYAQFAEFVQLANVSVDEE